ncbi:MAG: hypothetical protein KBT12_05045 [Bacteroidales bacterium]|nr:hypothetical protein [Candidatus Physcousia equi]
MKKNTTLWAVGIAALLLLNACNKSARTANDADSTAVAQQDPEGATAVPDFDMSRPLCTVLDGDTIEKTIYDAQGRVVMKGCMRDGEEGGDPAWYAETFTYDKDGYLTRTDYVWGEWENWEQIIYDDQHRAIRKESESGFTTHYTWDGLTRTDDGFCVEQLTYSDKTYQHVAVRKSYVSNNGPISSESTFDAQGREIRCVYYTDGVPTSATEEVYADNKCQTYSLKLNADGTEAKRTATWVTEYYPNGKYDKVARTYTVDGSMEGYTQQFDELGRPVHFKNEYQEYDIHWEGNTSTYTADGMTYSTTYEQTKQ